MKRRSPITRRPSKETPVQGTSMEDTLRGLGSRVLKILVVLSIITVLSVSFLSIYHYLLRSPHMKLERVQIKGVDKRFRNELIALCGVNAEPNLLALKLGELKQRIEAHPWIRSARLERRFPHTLIIEIQRQVPAAILLSDKLYYLNPWGEAFKAVSRTEDVDFPVITGISQDVASEKERLKAVAQIMKILRSETGPWSAEKLSEVNVKKHGRVSLYYSHLKAEIRCDWHNLSTKMPGLRRVADHLETSGKLNRVSRIDLNYADGAVVSFETG
ncbi:MAG: FtsQ-type POTRA domain-containing protein [Desulfatiglandaceae bacterium]